MTHHRQVERIYRKHPEVLRVMACFTIGGWGPFDNTELTVRVARADRALFAHEGDQSLLQSVVTLDRGLYEGQSGLKLTDSKFFPVLLEQDREGGERHQIYSGYAVANVAGEGRVVRKLFSEDGKHSCTGRAVVSIVRMDEACYYQGTEPVSVNESGRTGLQARRQYGSVDIILYLPPKLGWLSVE